MAYKPDSKAPLELVYWPTIPGRGEFVRLALEATSTPYKDICNERTDGINELKDLISAENASGFPLFAPPMLKIPSLTNVEGTGPLVIHQAPNILIYLASKIGLDGGKDEVSQLTARQIMLTALDLNNEAHDTHHPVGVMDYYEDQKDEALRKSTDFRKNRIPKFFSYFELALRANEAHGQMKHLVGKSLSIADIAVWQVVDGLLFAFPKELAARNDEYQLLLNIFYPAFKEQPAIKEYLASSRRLKYSSGIFRHYPELDRQD